MILGYERAASSDAGQESFPGEGRAMRRATGSGELRLVKVRSLWNRLAAASNLGFAVWVVYGILYALGHWTAAAVAGLAIMLAIVARESRTANVQIIDFIARFFVFALIMLLDESWPLRPCLTSSPECERSPGQNYSPHRLMCDKP
jgi:hypothetical protein